MKYKDAHYRSIIKAFTWRVLATMTTMSIVFAFTRKVLLSVGVGVVEVIVKLTVYYLHERLWLLIPFGKRDHPLSELSIKEDLKREDIEEIKSKLAELGYIE